MRLNTKLVLTSLLLASSTLSAQNDPISGTWNGWIGRTEANPASAKFEMKMAADGKLSGKVTGSQITPGEISSGWYDSKTGTLKFTVTIKAADGSGKGGDVTFDGRVSNDSASGKMVLGGENGMFRMAKAGAVEKGNARAVSEDPGIAVAKRGFVEVSGWITRAAEMVPPEKYSYRPTSTVRTFGELVAHVVDGSKYYCSKGAGKNVEWMDATEKKVVGKPAIVAALKQAFADCNAAYASGKDLAPLMENVSHSSLHYGNIITYMRMMGMVPPSS